MPGVTLDLTLGRLVGCGRQIIVQYSLMNRTSFFGLFDGLTNSMFPLRYPYYASPGALPGPIPTVVEIECSEELFYEAGGSKLLVLDRTW